MASEPMSPPEFADEIRNAMRLPDCEVRHMETDRQMEELLIALGYGEAVAVIRADERWYS